MFPLAHHANPQGQADAIRQLIGYIKDERDAIGRIQDRLDYLYVEKKELNFRTAEGRQRKQSIDEEIQGLKEQRDMAFESIRRYQDDIDAIKYEMGWD